jgi:alpha-tubulin suppressor-like RCC1 family protein
VTFDASYFHTGLSGGKWFGGNQGLRAGPHAVLVSNTSSSGLSFTAWSKTLTPKSVFYGTRVVGIIYSDEDKNGYRFWGEAGGEYNDYTTTQPPVAYRSGVKTIVGGDSHLTALYNNGGVTTWFYSGWGYTTHGFNPEDFSPGAIPTFNWSPPSGVSFTAIEAQALYVANIGLDTRGKVHTWGLGTTYDSAFSTRLYNDGLASESNPFWNTVPQPGYTLMGQPYDYNLNDGTFVSIGAGEDHFGAVRDDGRLFLWGDSVGGAFAQGDTQKWVPNQSYTDYLFVPQGVSFSQISCGYFHNVGLMTNGGVTAWGNNGNDQCNVPASCASGVISICAGNGYSIALKNDGTLIGWGDYPWIPGGSAVLATNIKAMAAQISSTGGDTNIIAIKEDGTIFVAGNDVGKQSNFSQFDIRNPDNYPVDGKTYGSVFSVSPNTTSLFHITPELIAGRTTSSDNLKFYTLY